MFHPDPSQLSLELSKSTSNLTTKRLNRYKSTARKIYNCQLFVRCASDKKEYQIYVATDLKQFVCWCLSCQFMFWYLFSVRSLGMTMEDIVSGNLSRWRNLDQEEDYKSTKLLTWERLQETGIYFDNLFFLFK